MQAKLDNEALYEMPGIGHSAFTKSLRYGGTLQLTEVGPPSVSVNIIQKLHCAKAIPAARVAARLRTSDHS